MVWMTGGVLVGILEISPMESRCGAATAGSYFSSSSRTASSTGVQYELRRLPVAK